MLRMPRRPYPYLPTLLVLFLLSLSLGACNDKPDADEPEGMESLTEEANPARVFDPESISDEQYAQMVEAFYTGVTAMEVGDADRARAALEEATEIVPGEPAAWSNLGLAYMRQPDLDAAAEAVAKAQELAPRSSEVLLLAGFLAQRRNDFEAAEALFIQSLEQDPENLRARYALAEIIRQTRTLDVSNDPNDDIGTVRRQFKGILFVDETNLAAILELALFAVEHGETAVVSDMVTRRLTPLAPRWPSDPSPDRDPRSLLAQAQGQLSALEADPSEENFKAIKGSLVALRNVLLPSDDYQDALTLYQSDYAAVTEPIQHFLVLDTPRAEPAEPDTALSFRAEPVENAEGALWAGALQIDPEAPPRLVVGFEDRIEIRGESIITLDYPAGGAPISEKGLRAIDWNNDLRPDLAGAGPGGFRLFTQDESGNFVESTADMGLAPGVLGGSYTSAWVVDIDLEGDLDLVLGGECGLPVGLRNGADGSWTVLDPSPFAASDGKGPNGLLDLAWGDLDLDGDPDLVVQDARGLWIALNERSLGYQVVALESSSEIVEDRAEDDEGASESESIGADAEPRLSDSISLVDLDRDGRLDLVDAAGLVYDPEEAWEADAVDGVGVAEGDPIWADLDNNGSPDQVFAGEVALSGDDEMRMLEGLPDFAEPGAVADLDGDGRLDIVSFDPETGPLLLMNEGGDRGYNHQVLRPRGVTAATTDQRNNSFGIGGSVEVRAGLLYQRLPIDSPQVHIGLGENPRSQTLRIHWPNGFGQAEFDIEAGETLAAEQRLKGSCPWLFAWNGERMDFVTDVLWRSPLGLRINAQDTAGVVQTRDWVLLKGDKVQPRDGMYDMRVTAELWETHFFDEVKLRVVDHPAELEAFVDERFSIPPPPLAVQLGSPVFPVSRALDFDGNEVTEAVSELDGVHHEDIGRGAYQGIAGMHYIEVEVDPAALAEALGGVEALEAAREEGRLRLVARGWVYPTDSSINVAISQGEHVPPIDLSLEAAGPDGGWQPVAQQLGFPAGKRKTLLIDITEAIAVTGAGSGSDSDSDVGPDSAPWRLRLSTAMEIRWDQLGVTALVATPDALDSAAVTENLREVELETATAELRYRGFSMTNRIDGSATVQQPEIPDYETLYGTQPIWLDLEGFYTRFGDISELLAATDDRYAILNAGDEMAFTFEAPPAPPEGWVRDLVFVSDGWVKDGDLNTSYSKTVRPLPAHDRPEYTLPGVAGPLGSLSEDEVYQRFPEDWETYHTRYVSPRGYSRALVPPVVE